MCVICNKQLNDKEYRTHHLDYRRCGNERIRDVVTLCDECHATFHQNWKQAEYFREEDENHWDMFSLEETAKLCGAFLRDDYWFGGELNCCNPDVCGELIDDYTRNKQLTVAPAINPNDIQLYFRNKRYDIILEEEKRGLILDRSENESCRKFLDEKFGKKGGKGGNKNRSDARSFIIKHDSESFNRNRHYLKYINILMKEATKYE